MDKYDLAKGDLAVGKSFFWMVWSGAISIANSVVLWIVMARSRDVDEVGRFAIVLGIYALFVSVCSLGLVPYLVSEISRRLNIFDRSDEVRNFVSSAALFMTGSGVVSAVLMTLLGLYATESASARTAIFILSFAMVPGGLITLAEAAAVAHGRTRIIAVVTSTENIVRTVIPLILILNGYGLPAICASFLAVRCLALAAYIPQSRGLVSRKWIRSGELRGIVRIAPTFAGTVIAASIMWQGPAVLLGRFSNELETAQYGAASRFMIPASILMASYADVIQPHLVHYAQRSRAMLGQYLRRIGSIPFVLAVIAAISSPFAAGLVLSTLFGSRYVEAASTLEIFAVCLIPYTLIMLMARGLISMRAQKIDLLANMIGALVLVAAGWILVPEYGAVGAAASQLLGFVLMAVIEVAAVTYLVNRPGSSRGTERSVETDSGWKMTGIPSLQSRPSDN